MKHRSRPVSFTSTLDSSHHQYTVATTISNACYVRARATDGSPVVAEIKHKPTYYLPTQTGRAADATGYDGTPLVACPQSSITAGREFCKKYPNRVWGEIQTEYQVLNDLYGAQEIAFSLDRLYIWNIDIEVDRDDERGFAKPDDPFNPITAITIFWRHMGKMGKVVYGTKDYTPIGDELYVRCADEQELLTMFMADFAAGGDYPDIITGWNVAFFDVPYLVYRLRVVFGDEDSITTKISPFGRFRARRAIVNHREQMTVDIDGVVVLDYLELYRKFTLSQRENYRLDYIAHIELGERKVSYAEYRSLKALYRQNHQKFIEYNLNDVALVDKLDTKLKYIQLVCALAYMAKSNFVDTLKQVRLWDVMIYHKLRGLDAVIPPRKVEKKEEQYEGAYVKDPQIGMHPWVVSFDVASMYPHIIRLLNLSPETLVTQVPMHKTLNEEGKHVVDVEPLLDKTFDTTAHTQPHDYAMAANGVLTRRDMEGFIPNMMKVLYDERVKFKTIAQHAKRELDTLDHTIKTEGSTPARLTQKQTLVETIASASNQEQVRKVNLNSAYGALGSEFFRFFDVRLAEAVTVTGKLIIREVANAVNAHLNRLLKTTQVDYVIASDTDSIYVTLGALVTHYQQRNPQATTDQITTMVDRFCKTQLSPVIQSAFDILTDYLNVHTPCMSMAREVIADKGLWLAKKHYILNLLDDKGGLRLKEPKLKMMGIEAVKSSTPGICRKMIIDAVKLFLRGTQEDVWTYIQQARVEFFKSPFEDVAFPRSVNDMRKYADQDKSLPITIRASKVFNTALHTTGLQAEFQPIEDGEKIRFCYLREPNPFFTNVIAAPGGCPEAWEIEKWIDYETQWSKAFLKPLEGILASTGWTTEYEHTLF